MKKVEESGGFTAEERAAMRERARDLKAAGKKEEGEKDLLAKIAAMAEPDRSICSRLHEIVRANASPRFWPLAGTRSRFFGTLGWLPQGRRRPGPASHRQVAIMWA